MQRLTRCPSRQRARLTRRTIMPLLCFDLIVGRSENQIKRILDVTHEVMVNAFNVPERNRYQIVREHAPSRMIVEDTGLGIARTPNMLVLQVTTRPPQSGHEANVL